MTIATPKWSIGAVTIFVDEYSGGQKPVVGELHVLDANNSTKHYSGSMGKTRRIAGTLYDTDSTKLGTLEGYAEAETARTLTSDIGSEGSYIVMDVQVKRQQALQYSYAVYRVTVELAEA